MIVDGIALAMASLFGNVNVVNAPATHTCARGRACAGAYVYTPLNNVDIVDISEKKKERRDFSVNKQILEALTLSTLFVDSR